MKPWVQDVVFLAAACLAVLALCMVVLTSPANLKAREKARTRDEERKRLKKEVSLRDEWAEPIQAWDAFYRAARALLATFADLRDARVNSDDGRAMFKLRWQTAHDALAGVHEQFRPEAATLIERFTGEPDNFAVLTGAAVHLNEYLNLVNAEHRKIRQAAGL